MLFDAIILTGGRSSRLDSVPKSEFVVEDSTLLDRTLRSAAGSRRTVVVGHAPAAAMPDDVILVREEPPFSGPVAAIAAGIAALLATSEAESEVEMDAAGTHLESDAVLVLACDMPHIGLAVPALLLALAEASDTDGVIAVDAGNRRQPLAALYRTNALQAALEASADSTGNDGPLANLSMSRLLDHMTLTEVRVPEKATDDVDTWDDALRLHAEPPTPSATTRTGQLLNKGNHHE